MYIRILILSKSSLRNKRGYMYKRPICISSNKYSTTQKAKLLCPRDIYLHIIYILDDFFLKNTKAITQFFYSRILFLTTVTLVSQKML